MYDILQTKIINGEKLPKDVYDYVYSYNEPKSAKEFLKNARRTKGKNKAGGKICKATQIDNFPDFYEKEALKCLELGLKPYKGLIFRVIGFY